MLKIENLRKSYDDFTLDCSMEVRSGCVTGLIGRSEEHTSELQSQR